MGSCDCAGVLQHEQHICRREAAISWDMHCKLTCRARFMLLAGWYLYLPHSL